jgi:hypothetical protein
VEVLRKVSEVDWASHAGWYEQVTRDVAGDV